MTDDWRQWGVLGVASAARFAAGILMGTSMAVFVGRQGSPLAVSLVQAAYFLGMMLFAPVWGAIADVTGRRRAVLVATSALATLAVLPLTAATGVWATIGLRGLYAVFAAGFSPIALTIASAHGGSDGRGRSLGIFNSTRGVGFAGGQLAAGVLLGLLVPASLYLVIAGVSLLSTLAAAFVADPTVAPETPRLDVGAVLAEVRSRLVPVRKADREHLRTNGLYWLYVALALRNMTVMGVFALLPPYLVGHVGVAEATMGVLLAVNPTGQVVFMALLGRVADVAGRKPLIVVGMLGSGLYGLAAAAATLPDALALRVALVAGALLLISASYSAMTTGALAFIGDVAPAERESELMGLRQTAKGVGGVVGPPVLGLAATVFSYEAALAGGSVLSLLATVVVAAGLVESRPSHRPAATPADDYSNN